MVLNRVSKVVNCHEMHLYGLSSCRNISGIHVNWRSVYVDTYTDVRYIHSCAYVPVCLNKDTCMKVCRYVCCVLVVDRESLDVFISSNLPVSSCEYTVGSQRYNEYIAALDKVLTNGLKTNHCLCRRFAVSLNLCPVTTASWQLHSQQAWQLKIAPHDCFDCKLIAKNCVWLALYSV